MPIHTARELAGPIKGNDEYPSVFAAAATVVGNMRARTDGLSAFAEMLGLEALLGAPYPGPPMMAASASCLLLQLPAREVCELLPPRLLTLLHMQALHLLSVPLHATTHRCDAASSHLAVTSSQAGISPGRSGRARRRRRSK